jgi:hypothetical protein
MGVLMIVNDRICRNHASRNTLHPAKLLAARMDGPYDRAMWLASPIAAFFLALGIGYQR